jgi:hypothetical protein
MSLRLGFLFISVSLLAFAGIAKADAAPFDLDGPRIEVTVNRASKTLPVSEVPNLQPGDRLWIHPVLSAGQSVRYLLAVVFLRGSTNPPPENWITKAETWSKVMREEGIVVTVPKEAQQALLLLAPQTGGDFGALRSAVLGKPGAFVRASQDLNQAGLDRSRLDQYLEEIKQISANEPNALHERSLLLARSLSVKVDPQCFDKPSEQQASCLTQSPDQLVLDDGHTQSMVSALTSGPGSDLIGAVSTTKLAGGGAYSAYVGAVVDLARMLENLHTPQYQYIPALALPKHDELNLKLNNPPSFRKPMSVLVVALPPVESALPPPVRPVEPDKVFCLQQPSLVLPVEGAPLAFSTNFAHDIALHVHQKSGEDLALPTKADPARGGFLADTHSLKASNLNPQLEGRLRGYWGFQTFDGPEFHLQTAHPAKWTISASESTSLIVGRDDTVRLQSDAASCLNQVSLKDQHGTELKANWTLIKPDEVELQLALKDATPGPLTLSFKQFGLAKADEVHLTAYSEAAHVDAVAINAGDSYALLTGARLDEVVRVDMNGVRFIPAHLKNVGQKDELQLSSEAAVPPDFRPNEKLATKVALKDGRIFDLQTVVEPPRPKVSLISKNIEPSTDSAHSAIHLANPDDLSQGSRLLFVLREQTASAFPRDEKIEVATEDDSYHVLLSVADGNLIPQDSQTVLAVLDPAKDFGPSAFGQLRFRAVNAQGAKGDWQPLARLVRIPTLKEVRCPDDPASQCKLLGTNLFLLDSVASNPEFNHEVSVPLGFANSTLSVPRPNGTLLYVKLRDDPFTVNKTVLPVLPGQ